ncbi:hypothetical protein RF11_02424 [Thelohanellus kitauei]|uniref:CCHC-type domain-containing protein n=1 Tax=Thelohanellus kitauei TaxID=669202 RepID=A0A0C2MRB0_THEKT|nr:hypothetical protein RF11_02424 [Thelohanellus kitauei]
MTFRMPLRQIRMFFGRRKYQRCNLSSYPYKNIPAALLQKRNSTLEETISLEESMIITSLTMRVTENAAENVTINRIQTIEREKRNAKVKLCKDCYKDHTRDRCPRYSKTCCKCGKLGHLAEVGMAHCTRIISRKSCYYISYGHLINPPINIEVFPFPLLVDMRASCSIINSSVIDSLNLKEDRSFMYEVKSFGGKPIPIQGFLWADISYNGQKNRCNLLTNDSPDCSNILGLDAIKASK